MESLKISTAALASGDAGNDAMYTALTNKIVNWTSERDELAAQMKELFYRTTFNEEVFTLVK